MCKLQGRQRARNVIQHTAGRAGVQSRGKAGRGKEGSLDLIRFSMDCSLTLMSVCSAHRRSRAGKLVGRGR